MGQFVSVKFKIHNPSAAKQSILDQVLTHYTDALRDQLEWSKVNLETIRSRGKYQPVNKETGEAVGKARYTDKSIMAILPKASEIKVGIASCLKESLVANVAIMLASYLELDESDKQDAGFPTSRNYDPEVYPEALEEFTQMFLLNDLTTTSNQSEANENQARYNLLRSLTPRFMPVHFTRSRDFAILEDTKAKRFFIWLKLLPQGEGKPLIIKEENLIDVNTGQVFTYAGRSALLLPIELGRRGDDWHWQYKQFIEPVKQGRGRIKAAKLVKEGDDYFLNISCDIEAPEKYEPVTYLGINRGIIHTVGYGVIDFDGNIVTTGHSNDPFQVIQERARRRIRNKQKRFAQINKRDYKRQELDNIVHTIINRLLDLAVEHQSMIVLEDWKLVNTGSFYRSAYQKVNQFITYKANLRGVPIYKRAIWGAYASQICIHCGRELAPYDRETRLAVCLACDRPEHVDEANAVNIARRVLYKKEDWGGTKEAAGNWRMFHCSFANAQDFRTEVDLQNGGEQESILT